MNIVEALHWRYAVDQFSTKKIPTQTLKNLLDATRLSASSYGLQPYHIMVIESPELKAQLLPYSYGQDKIYHCSHLVVFAAHRNIGDNTVDRYINKYAEVTAQSRQTFTKYSEHIKSALRDQTAEQKQQWAHQQAYIALGNFLTCAAMMQIDSCPMTGFDNQGYDQVLSLNELGLTTTVICPVGYRHPNDKQAQRPKVRFDYHEMISER